MLQIISIDQPAVNLVSSSINIEAEQKNWIRYFLSLLATPVKTQESKRSTILDDRKAYNLGV